MIVFAQPIEELREVLDPGIVTGPEEQIDLDVVLFARDIERIESDAGIVIEGEDVDLQLESVLDCGNVLGLNGIFDIVESVGVEVLII